MENAKQPKKAEQDFLEALAIYRELMKNNPATYDLRASGWPGCSINWPCCITTRSGPKEAEQNFRDALTLYRELANINAGAYQPLVAGTLNNLANLSEKTQRVKEAEQAFREALVIRWGLAKSNPRVYQRDVSTTFHDWATMYSGINKSKPSGSE